MATEGKMQEFRRFILSVVSVLELLFVVSLTLICGIFGAVVPGVVGGSGWGLFGFLIGALAGFSVSAILVNISMCLAEIAANTYHLKKPR
jgi:hypothetical protein